MKKYFATLSLVAVGLTFLASCSKDKSVDPPGDNSPRLMNKWSTANGSMTIKYDSKYRLTELINTSIVIQKLNYLNGILTAEFRDNNNFTYFDLHDGKLDAGGRMTEIFMDYHEAGKPDQLYKYEFTYNAEGYLVHRKRTNIGTILVEDNDYTWVDGNLVKDVISYNGQYNSRHEYSYYTESNPLTLDILYMSMTFLTDGLTGKRSKNLMKLKQSYNTGNALVNEILYSYTLDTKGFPTGYKLKNLMNNYEGNVFFEYNKP